MDRDAPGRAIIQKFAVSYCTVICVTRLHHTIKLVVQDALQGRENPLPDLVENPEFSLDALEDSVGREIEEQFNVSLSEGCRGPC